MWRMADRHFMFGCEYSNEVNAHHLYQEVSHGFSNFRGTTSESSEVFTVD
jgi:hypothetical protein